jgi:hypothetical protein
LNKIVEDSWEYKENYDDKDKIELKLDENEFEKIINVIRWFILFTRATDWELSGKCLSKKILNFMEVYQFS